MSYKNKKILAVVPARGGSKGIPGKNLKLIQGKPLIDYILKTLLKVKEIDKIVVSSDCPEILDHSSKFVEVIKRPPNLAKDAVTLDPIIYHAHSEMSADETYDYIFTFQPTSPLLSVKTIQESIKKLIDTNSDSLLSVVDDRHLNWTIKNNVPVPIYSARVNRQQLPPNFRETGGIIACSKETITETTRLGKTICLVETPFEESIDIDTYYDLVMVNSILKMPKLAFIVTGNKQTGFGHIYRTLLLASRLQIKPLFFVNSSDILAIQKIKSANYSVHEFNSLTELNEELDAKKINLVINDTLDTTKDYILYLKSNDRFVVSFEDFGEGSEIVDLIINALFENHSSSEGYFGHKFVCLRDEFLFCNKKEISESVKNILITFGGTDPNDITSYVLKKLIDFKEFNIEIIVGPGYSNLEKLSEFVKSYPNIELFSDVKKMSKHMLKADIIISSNGRTTYEVASLGIPTIVFCQNQREIKHLFGELTKTIINLGLFTDLEDDKFLNTFDELVKDFDKRKKFNEKMLNLNLLEGTDRVIQLILNKYNKFRRGLNE